MPRRRGKQPDPAPASAAFVPPGLVVVDITSSPTPPPVGSRVVVDLTLSRSPSPMAPNGVVIHSPLSRSTLPPAAPARGTARKAIHLLSDSTPAYGDGDRFNKRRRLEPPPSVNSAQAVVSSANTRENVASGATAKPAFFVPSSVSPAQSQLLLDMDLSSSSDEGIEITSPSTSRAHAANPVTQTQSSTARSSAAKPQTSQIPSSSMDIDDSAYYTDIEILSGPPSAAAMTGNFAIGKPDAKRLTKKGYRQRRAEEQRSGKAGKTGASSSKPEGRSRAVPSTSQSSANLMQGKQQAAHGAAAHENPPGPLKPNDMSYSTTIPKYRPTANTNGRQRAPRNSTYGGHGHVHSHPPPSPEGKGNGRQAPDLTPASRKRPHREDEDEIILLPSGPQSSGHKYRIPDESKQDESILLARRSPVLPPKLPKEIAGPRKTQALGGGDRRPTLPNNAASSSSTVTSSSFSRFPLRTPNRHNIIHNNIPATATTPIAPAILQHIPFSSQQLLSSSDDEVEAMSDLRVQLTTPNSPSHAVTVAAPRPVPLAPEATAAHFPPSDPGPSLELDWGDGPRWGSDVAAEREAHLRQKSRSKRDEYNAFCMHCKRRGHTANQCLNTVCYLCGSVNTHSARNCDATKVCYKCGERGHLRKHCPQRRKPDAHRLCERCGRQSHGGEMCPSHWEMYDHHSRDRNEEDRVNFEAHNGRNILEAGAIERGEGARCAHCLQRGHMADHCPANSSEDPRPSAFGVHNARPTPFYIDSKRSFTDSYPRRPSSHDYATYTASDEDVPDHLPSASKHKGKQREDKGKQPERQESSPTHGGRQRRPREDEPVYPSLRPNVQSAALPPPQSLIRTFEPSYDPRSLNERRSRLGPQQTPTPHASQLERHSPLRPRHQPPDNSVLSPGTPEWQREANMPETMSLKEIGFPQVRKTGPQSTKDGRSL